METRANYLLVASFVLAIVACNIGGAILLLNLHPFPDTRAYYDIYFRGSVAGLKIEAPVLLSGIPIGNVRKIEINPQDPAEVHLTIEVSKDAAIRSDSIASLDVNFVYGDASISITGGSASAPPLAVLPGHVHPIITSRAPQLETLATDFVQRTTEVLDTLIKMSDDRNRQAISEALQDMEELTARRLRQVEQLGGVIDRADAAVRNAQSNEVAFRAKLGEITQTLALAQTNLDDASAIVRKIDNWVHDFDGVVQEIRPGQSDLAGNLKDLDGTVMAWRQLVGHLARYVDDFERNPMSTLFGKPRDGYKPK